MLLISTFKLHFFSTHKKAAIYDFEINFLCFLLLKVILHLKLLHATLMFNKKYQYQQPSSSFHKTLRICLHCPQFSTNPRDPQKVEKVVLLNHFKNY